MIEVFRTNVTSDEEARRIIGQILTEWPELKMNFDLDDCDNILRVEFINGRQEVKQFVQYLKDSGYTFIALE